MVTAIQELPNCLGNCISEVIYNPARGTVNIERKSEGIHANKEFIVPSGFGIVDWMRNTDSDYPWRNIGGTVEAIDINKPLIY